MTAPSKVLELIDLFRRNADAYHAPQYNEAMVRQEFINPFFKSLGWDMDNEQGYAEAYKDVIHEAAIKIGGATKAPDYCFRIGGSAKFFLEAKRPSVNLKDDPAPAYQLRRYAWTGKLSLSVLTDFEEFAVYDCRVKPAHTDKAGVARILYLRYDDYAERWDEIAGVFARESILKGSFDKYAEAKKTKRGTAAVDTAFLQEIENWRDVLARNLALRNPNLSQRELNYAVQVTIDRIIFLRMCEDRGVEPYGQLQKLQQGSDIYSNLLDLYRKADERYNSGLFHFHAEKGRPEAPDTLTPSLLLDDKPLKDILHGLYYPECPYEFSVLSGEILGQVYEQFLGKVIRLTAGHQAKVEDKPEVRKAGGVYYTPTYIVDYIVKQTVGKLLGEPGASAAGLTPKQAAKLRILDPACGSGSFLLGAYQLLLDWHRDRYLADGPKKHTKELYQGTGGVWRLTTAEKKRILLANIYGVDIDPQAVEVTKLSLLLKVLEGESEQTLQSQLRIFHERALPDLSSNIQCGNSLIGPDFYDGQQMDLFDEEERYRINVFDWHAAFPWLREAGGFDVVIGNPPYVRIQGFPRQQIVYLAARYRSAKGNFDLYVSFVERGYELLTNQGRLGKIVPNKFFKTDYGEGLRELISTNKAVAEIVDFGSSQVFDATTYTCLLFLTKSANRSFNYAEALAKSEALLTLQYITKSSETLNSEGWLFANEETSTLLAKLGQNSKRLLDLPADMSRGSSSGDDETFVLEEQSLDLDIEAEILRIPVFASDFGRYSFFPSGKWRIIFPYVFSNDSYRLYTEDELRRKFPKAFAYLLAHQAQLKRRKQYKEWFGFSAPRNLELHDRAKIIVPLLADRGLFALIPPDTCGKLCPMASGGFTITPSPDCSLNIEYILGLLNSRLLFWKLQQMSNIFRGGWITCTKQYFGELPIRMVNFADPAEKARHDRLVQMVEHMISRHKQLAIAKMPQEQTMLQRQLDATDRQIDRLVYELYGLTDAEIQIVEAAKP
jgi:adenine-specific DNA methylase